MFNQLHQINEWLTIDGSEGEEEVSPTTTSLQVGTLVDLRNGNIIYPSNLNSCINKEDQVAGKSNVTATLLGGEEIPVKVLDIGETGSIYATALNCANDQLISGQTIFDSYQTQVVEPMEETPGNNMPPVSKNQVKKSDKGKRGRRKQSAKADSRNKPDNSFALRLAEAECNGSKDRDEGTPPQTDAPVETQSEELRPEAMTVIPATSNQSRSVPPLKVTDFVQPQILREAIKIMVDHAQKQGLCGKQLTLGGTPEKLETLEIETAESILEAMKPRPTNAVVKGIRYVAKGHFGEELIRNHSFLGVNGSPGLTPRQCEEMKLIADWGRRYGLKIGIRVWLSDTKPGKIFNELARNLRYSKARSDQTTPQRKRKTNRKLFKK